MILAVCFILSFFVVLLSCNTVSGLAYDVAKLKTKMNKMKATLTRHNTKEQSKVTAQALLPKFVDKAKNAVGRLHEEEYTNGFTTFELLVRRTQTGPWYRYQDLLGTEATNDFVDNVILGGLEAEDWRMKLDNWVSMQIFGTGTGAESIKKVKETLIQFKKLKPREFEFGYRIAVDGETVYSVEKSMKEVIQIPRSRSPSMARVNVTSIISGIKDLSPSDVASVNLQTRISLRSNSQVVTPDGEHVSEIDRQTHPATSMSILQEIILQFYDKMLSHNADGCLFFSDGSATLSEDGLGCAAACCGIFLLPTKKDLPLYSISESVCVNLAGGMIDSPFDAELIAGLSAVTLAKLIAAIISKRTKNNETGSQEGNKLLNTNSVNLTAQVDGLANSAIRDINSIAFMLHTDSKTLCRAIRTGPKGDLADRASPSRLALWKLLSSHTEELQVLGMPMSVEWIPGHPERRDTDRSRWSVRDIGIWMADEIAKTEGDKVTASFINSRPSTADGSNNNNNNNKLVIRAVEKVAKFPKKVAEKAAKKSGVKKKNYYNTKLSFSKDPRNPNVAAAAIAVASGTTVDSVIAADVEVVSNVEDEGSLTSPESDESASEEADGHSEGDLLSLDGGYDNGIAAETAESLQITEVIDDKDTDMEDVDVLDVVYRTDEPSLDVVNEEPATVPVAVIGAADMIQLSALLDTSS